VTNTEIEDALRPVMRATVDKAWTLGSCTTGALYACVGIGTCLALHSPPCVVWSWVAVLAFNLARFAWTWHRHLEAA